MIGSDDFGYLQPHGLPGAGVMNDYEVDIGLQQPFFNTGEHVNIYVS